MKCPDVLDLLDDHVDGLLPAPQAESVRDHLDGCRECRETALATSAATASLATWRDVDPPADCFDSILERIDSMPAEVLARHPSSHGASSHGASSHGASSHGASPAAALVPVMGPVNRLRFLESPRAERARWFATTGLAAAAAVLAAVVITKSDDRAMRRPYIGAGSPLSVSVGNRLGRSEAASRSDGPWLEGYDLEDGLRREGGPSLQRRPQGFELLGLPR